MPVTGVEFLIMGNTCCSIGIRDRRDTMNMSVKKVIQRSWINRRQSSDDESREVLTLDSSSSDKAKSRKEKKLWPPTNLSRCNSKRSILLSDSFDSLSELERTDSLIKIESWDSPTLVRRGIKKQASTSKIDRQPVVRRGIKKMASESMINYHPVDPRKMKKQASEFFTCGLSVVRRGIQKQVSSSRMDSQPVVSREMKEQLSESLTDHQPLVYKGMKEQSPESKVDLQPLVHREVKKQASESNVFRQLVFHEGDKKQGSSSRMHHQPVIRRGVRKQASELAITSTAHKSPSRVITRALPPRTQPSFKRQKDESALFHSRQVPLYSSVNSFGSIESFPLNESDFKATRDFGRLERWDECKILDTDATSAKKLPDMPWHKDEDILRNRCSSKSAAKVEEKGSARVAQLIIPLRQPNGPRNLDVEYLVFETCEGTKIPSEGQLEKNVSGMGICFE